MYNSLRLGLCYLIYTARGLLGYRRWNSAINAGELATLSRGSQDVDSAVFS